MAIYVILSKFSESAFREPEEFAKVAKTVVDKIKTDCSEVHWKESYATTGRFDIVDIVEAPDVMSAERAAMIIRGYGHAVTETLVATPFEQFLESLSRQSASMTG